MKRSTTRVGAATAVLAATATALGVALAPAPSSAEHASAQANGHRTAVTLQIDDADGTRVWLAQSDGESQAWQSKVRKVEDGEVTLRVPTKRTTGSRLFVAAPWEGTTGYTTEVVIRYAGKQTGDPVSVRQARGKDRATGCWSGTNAQRVTIPVTVREVRVKGTTGKTAGTLAFTEVTDRWGRPMEPVVKGVLGAQDIAGC